MSNKQIEAVIALSGPERYSHFVKVSADRGLIWGLFSDGWALAATDDETSAFPIWPASEYAALCANGDWANYKPKEIKMDEVFEWLFPKLRESSMQLAVFYTPSDKGIICDLETAEADLRNELSNF
jgi:hypothetical protein